MIYVYIYVGLYTGIHMCVDMSDKKDPALFSLAIMTSTLSYRCELNWGFRRSSFALCILCSSVSKAPGFKFRGVSRGRITPWFASTWAVNCKLMANQHLEALEAGLAQDAHDKLKQRLDVWLGFEGSLGVADCSDEAKTCFQIARYVCAIETIDDARFTPAVQPSDVLGSEVIGYVGAVIAALD